MAVDFSVERWKRVRESYSRWWAGELKRPLIQMTIHGRNPGRPEPSLPSHGFTAFYEPSVSADAIVDRYDYDLSCRKFMGDGFPSVWPNFGPGVLAAFLGATIRNDSGTCWFIPKTLKPPKEISLARFSEEDQWLRRVKEICEAAMERWEGLVQVSMTDMGGNLDVLSTFRPSENLLLDLYDNPDEVRRLLWEVYASWWRAFDDINSVLRPVNPGYTAWTPIFSSEPYYMLQCDFCYMISPDMFDEFVKPELVASCRRLKNAFYHLDGVGQLPHLDSLLKIRDLKGIQWVPGAGQPPISRWLDVYRKIHDAGKLIQIWGGPKELEALARGIGTAEGIIILSDMPASQETEAVEFLTKYGAL